MCIYGNTKKIRTYRDAQYGKNTASGCTMRKNNVRFLLYSYNFNPIKNTHLRHVTVHYFSRIVQPEAIFFPYWTSNTFFFLRIVHYVREVNRWFFC